MYNYDEAMKQDIMEYLEDEFEYRYSNCENVDELHESLYDDLFASDRVTGNASGSYFCNTYKARECVVDNMEYCIEALKEFCVEPETIAEHFLNEDWEYFDVTIRCYLLGSVISDVLDEMEEDLEKHFASLEKND